MKNLLIIAVLMITLTANAQARLGAKSKDIYEEFKNQGIEYEKDEESFFLFYFFNEDLVIQYYFDEDSICNRILIQTFTEEMTDFIINTYDARGYLRVKDGWLPRNNGIISKILHIVEKNNWNLFVWY